MFNKNDVDLNSGESLIKGFAQARQFELISESELETFVSECVGGDVALTRIILDKVDIQIECMKMSSYAISA